MTQIGRYGSFVAAALPPYGLSRCASQAKPAAANAGGSCFPPVDVIARGGRCVQKDEPTKEKRHEFRRLNDGSDHQSCFENLDRHLDRPRRRRLTGKAPSVIQGTGDARNQRLQTEVARGSFAAIHRCTYGAPDTSRDSGSDPKGENSRSEVEGEASQSGAAKTAHRPNSSTTAGLR